MGRRAVSIAGLGLALAFAGSPPARALPVQGVALLVGPFEAQHPERDLAAGWEVRFAERRFSFLPAWVPPLEPVAGALATSEGALYGYGGFRLELPLGARWRLAPHWGLGFYSKAEGRNLGGELEFRSGLDLLWRIHGETWLGVGLFHLSNAHIYHPNPGSETAFLTLSTRLGPRRR